MFKGAQLEGYGESYDPSQSEAGRIFLIERRNNMGTSTDFAQLKAIATRIREMRDVMGWSPA